MLTSAQRIRSKTTRRRTFFRSSANVVAISCAAVTALLLAAGPHISWAQTNDALVTSASAKLSPEDYNFVAQAFALDHEVPSVPAAFCVAEALSQPPPTAL